LIKIKKNQINQTIKVKKKTMKTKKPLISILMPAYNCEKYVGEAIESVLQQTYKNFEFIIIDDCSTDNTWKIIQKYSRKDKRIKTFRNEKNLNRPKSRNKLLSLITEKSSYFLWMDSDDIVKKEIIDKKVNYMQNHKNISGLGSSIDYVDENLKLIKTRKYPKTNKEIKKKFLIYSPISQGGMMLRSELKKEKFNPKFSVCQDYELWCRLISKGYKFENLNESLYLYRQNKEQGKQKNLRRTILNTLKIKNKYIFKRKYFNIKALIRYLLEVLALILPKKITLLIFYKTLKRQT
jgi:glycosyltransferase involved in cell wall biosynthesis